jgi:dihydrofolate reductase
MIVTFVVAAADNGVIGRNGQLPWRMPTDLKRFRKLTMGKPVVMGRKTYESLRKPLDGRDNIVVTRQSDFTAPGIHVAAGIEQALALAHPLGEARNADEIAVIGGADLYAQAMPAADRLEITRVHAEIPGDVLFPFIDPAIWREVARTEQAAGPGDEADMTFITYRAAAVAGGSPSPAL